MAFVRSNRRVEYELVPEERASRPFAALNVRREDKEVFDQLQLWWSMREGRPLSQWDVFSRMVALVLTHAEGDMPPERIWKGP